MNENRNVFTFCHGEVLLEIKTTQYEVWEQNTLSLAKDPIAEISPALLDLFTIQISLLKLQEIKINKKWQ